MFELIECQMMGQNFRRGLACRYKTSEQTSSGSLSSNKKTNELMNKFSARKWGLKPPMDFFSISKTKPMHSEAMI